MVFCLGVLLLGLVLIGDVLPSDTKLYKLVFEFGFLDFNPLARSEVDALKHAVVDTVRNEDADFAIRKFVPTPNRHGVFEILRVIE